MIARRGHKRHQSVKLDAWWSACVHADFFHNPSSNEPESDDDDDDQDDTQTAVISEPRLAQNVNCSVSISSASSTPYFAPLSISIEPVYWYLSMRWVSLVKSLHHLGICSPVRWQVLHPTQNLGIIYKVWCNTKFDIISCNFETFSIYWFISAMLFTTQ